MKYIKRFLLPAILFIAAIFFSFFIGNYLKTTEYVNFFDKLGSVLFIVSLAWISIVSLRVSKKLFLEKYDISEEDNLRSRKFQTQFNLLEKIIVVLIIIIGIGLTLMLFEDVRDIGKTLFTSAGIAGIIIGLASQKLIAAVLAGLQIAITQPIRLDDVVIMENEWGRIEEITLTYVVINIWDKRRLIVPTTYIFEKPFQNWTRTTAELMCTVFIYTDYNVPFDALRSELTRLLESTPLWDRKVNVLQVTDSKEYSVEIRALMSAKDSPTAWDLRVYVREKLIEFLQKNYPDSLPKKRIKIEDGNFNLD